MILGNNPSENIVGKGENAGKQHFPSFPTMFSALPKTNFNFSAKFNLSSANAFNLVRSKTVLFGKELTFSYNFHTIQVTMLIFGMQVAFNNTQLVRVISSRSRSNIKVTFLKKWPFWGH